jgi:hypothetical protein
MMARQQSKIDPVPAASPAEPVVGNGVTPNGHAAEVTPPVPQAVPSPAPAPHLPVVSPQVTEELKPLMVENTEEESNGGWPPPLYFVPNATKSEIYYMKNRWQTQWLYYDKKASENKRKYQAIQVFIGIASVSVPVLLTAASTYPTLTLVASVVSAMVAGSAAIENVKKYGENWRSYRQAAESLAREKSMYDVVAGPYRSSKRAFLRFVERCEDIMSEQNGQWHQRGDEPQAAAAAAASSKDLPDTDG